MSVRVGEGGKLLVAPAASITPAQREAILASKAALVSLLTAEGLSRLPPLPSPGDLAERWPELAGVAVQGWVLTGLGWIPAAETWERAVGSAGSASTLADAPGGSPSPWEGRGARRSPGCSIEGTLFHEA